MLFIQLSINGHLGCFNLLAIVNNAAVSAQKYIFAPVFNSFIYIFGSRITGS